MAETARLILRNWREDDLDTLYSDLLGHPEVMQFSSGPMSPESVEKWLQRKRMTMNEEGFSHWAVERKADGRLIGVCGLALQTLPEGRYPEVGYRFAVSAWGQGFATEAARASVSWAWKNTNWGRVTAIIEPANHRSVRVAEKLGMAVGWRTEFHGRVVDIYSKDNPRGGERGPF